MNPGRSSEGRLRAGAAGDRDEGRPSDDSLTLRAIADHFWPVGSEPDPTCAVAGGDFAGGAVDMPDVGTPQATWRDDRGLERKWRGGRVFGAPEPYLPPENDVYAAMADAVAADRRIQAARLRAKIEALDWPQYTPAAVLDAVLGGDS